MRSSARTNHHRWPRPRTRAQALMLSTSPLPNVLLPFLKMVRMVSLAVWCSSCQAAFPATRAFCRFTFRSVSAVGVAMLVVHGNRSFPVNVARGRRGAGVSPQSNRNITHESCDGQSPWERGEGRGERGVHGSLCIGPAAICPALHTRHAPVTECDDMRLMGRGPNGAASAPFESKLLVWVVWVEVPVGSIVRS